MLSETTWDEARRVSQGLVLTEWKRVRRENQRVIKAREAFEQAKLYCADPLAGFELTSTRYIVLVSQEHLEMPPPEIVAGVTYEFRNIAVGPKSPSLAARKAATSETTESLILVKRVLDAGYADTVELSNPAVEPAVRASSFTVRAHGVIDVVRRFAHGRRRAADRPLFRPYRSLGCRVSERLRRRRSKVTQTYIVQQTPGMTHFSEYRN